MKKYYVFYEMFGHTFKKKIEAFSENEAFEKFMAEFKRTFKINKADEIKSEKENNVIDTIFEMLKK